MRGLSSTIRLIVGALALAAVALVPAGASADYQPPPIRHVWVILFENASWKKSTPSQLNGPCTPFNSPGCSPYLANVLTKQGNLLTQYWGIGHNSLDNYIAMVSGQSPTPCTQSDALLAPDIGKGDWKPSDPAVDPHGQVIGGGCTYPAKVKTLADQLEAQGLTWRGYMQDFRDNTARDGVDCPSIEINGNAIPGDQYAKKHDPWQWFHSIIDDQSACRSHDVSLWDLAHDLQSVRTTPNFSFISPGAVDDGHDVSGAAGWAANPDAWLRQYVPMIMSSPAYRQDGMIIVTFDESNTIVGVPTESSEDDGACCNEIPGPNSPMPGIGGPGGGRVGALVLSPFVKPGTVDDPPDNPTHTGPGFYNQYSFLRSMEDLFGIKATPEVPDDDGQGHLGFAGTYADYPGPGSFGPDVYNGWDGKRASAASPEPPHGPTGPRAADGSATWQNPLPQGGDLEGVSCATTSACVAVGDAGTILASSDGGESWSARSSGVGDGLMSVTLAARARLPASRSGARAKSWRRATVRAGRRGPRGPVSACGPSAARRPAPASLPATTSKARDFSVRPIAAPAGSNSRSAIPTAPSFAAHPVLAPVLASSPASRSASSPTSPQSTRRRTPTASRRPRPGPVRPATARTCFAL